MTRLALALLAACLLPGCSDDPPPPKPVTPPTPVEPPPKPVDPPPTPVDPPTSVAPTLTEQAARAVFDRWLAAQNDGDFEAYAATYAPRFFGIKRAGPRTSRFDRDGWMKDRRRMFEKPMTVSADDLRVTPGPGTARVRFTQTWASGDYRDVGPKQLVMTLHEKQPRIAREEMLASTVIGPAPQDAGPAGVRFVRMLDAPYVILSEPVETAAAPRLLARGRPYVAAAAAPRSPHVGRAVTLYGPNGRRCGGTIEEVVVLGMVIPHFGAVQTWDGEMQPGGKKASADEVAAAVWQMSDGGGRYLAGKVDKAATDCAGAVFARLEGPDRPAAATWRPTPVPPAQQNAAVEQIRRSDAWKDIQAAYEAQHGAGAGPWDGAGVTRITARGFTAPGGAALAVIKMDAGLGCGGFGGGLWQAFTVDGLRLTPIGQPVAEPFTPAAAMDLGGALPSLIGVEGYSGDGAVYAPKDGAYAPASTLPILDLDCPC